MNDAAHTTRRATGFQAWADTYRHYSDTRSGLSWPSETLVRLLRGAYIPGLPADFAGASVLDVGCGTGNNLAFLGSLGLQLHGTEVDQSICDTTAHTLETLGLKADLRVGTNRELPFENDRFDLLVSWNVLHYEQDEEAVVAGIAEYARVLKPSGRLLLSTTGPRHQILDGARTLGDHRYLIQRDDDFRRGETFFYFDSPNYVDYYFSQNFNDVLVGRTTDELFDNVLDWWLVTAIRKA